MRVHTMATVSATFLKELAPPEPFNANACINCGVCTAICPMGLDILPRELFRYVLLGLKDKVIENQQSFQELQTFTQENPVPILVLLNKRDLPGAIPVAKFRYLLDLPEDTSTKKMIYQSIANDMSNLGDVKVVFIEMIQQILKRRL